MRTNNTVTETFYESGYKSRSKFVIEIDPEGRIVDVEYFERGPADKWDDDWNWASFNEEDYFPGYRSTGVGNPPNWDRYLYDWPRVGQFVPPRRDLTFEE